MVWFKTVSSRKPSSSSPAPADPAHSRDQSQWLWRQQTWTQPKDSHRSCHDDIGSLTRSRQAILVPRSFCFITEIPTGPLTAPLASASSAYIDRGSKPIPQCTDVQKKDICSALRTYAGGINIKTKTCSLGGSQVHSVTVPTLELVSAQVTSHPCLSG